MDQHFVKNTIKIQAWRHQNRGLEGSGASLEASWAIMGHPGRLWKRLGPSWKRLGSVLEASWAVLDRKKWPTRLQGCSQNGSQIYKKNNLKIDHLFDATWNHHLSVFLRFLESKTEPCWFENALKNPIYLNKP